MHFLSEAKVYQLEVAISVDENIVRFQVSVCNTLFLVQIFEYENNLRGIYLRCRLIKPAGSSKITKYFTTGAIVELKATQRIV